MRISTIIIALMLVPLKLLAQSFMYNYQGVNFECKVKQGKAIVKWFDSKVSKVLIPSQVKDKKGKSYVVSKVDLYTESQSYDTKVVVIETGVSEIDNLCFYRFRNLQTIYIPNSIERVGKKAFNLRYMPIFKMPSTISKLDICAGKEILTHAPSVVEIDPLANIDLSDYGEDNAVKANDEVMAEEPAPKPVGITPGTSDVDFNIPAAKVNRENTFCLIIANEIYRQKDTPNVKYATQDGKTFNDYCSRTLGLPKENVRMVSNASFLQMKGMLDWLGQVAEVYGKDANFIVYYAGHGVPDEKGNCKLIPSDVSINDVNNGFSLKNMYESLGKLTSSNVLVLIDACFSGNDRGDVAALDEAHRGIVRKVNQDAVSGNVVVLTAASGTETALSFDEKAHGLFSYYLMKKLQDTKGDVTYGELYDYIKTEVMRRSIVAKGKKQTPNVSFSGKLANSWKNIKL